MATGGSPSGALEAIVLAAGSGTRFGGAKLTAPWRGGLLIDGALTAAFAAPARTVTVVTGADGQVETAARDFADRRAESPRLRFVLAADHAQGMSATLRAGIASLGQDTDGVFVFLGDMPLIPVAVLPALADALGSGAAAAAPFFDGQRGHPVLFSEALFKDLRALAGDTGARSILASIASRLALVPSPDAGVLFDVDKPMDLTSGV